MKPAGSAQSRLRVTQQALIGVVPGTEPIGIGVKLRECRIDFAESDHERAILDVGACVAGRLQLSGAQDPLLEGSQFIDLNRGAVGGIPAYDGRLRRLSAAETGALYSGLCRLLRARLALPLQHLARRKSEFAAERARELAGGSKTGRQRDFEDGQRGLAQQLAGALQSQG